eukprot:13081278-Alexandrium_andersonii.AAC.1
MCSRGMHGPTQGSATPWHRSAQRQRGKRAGASAFAQSQVTDCQQGCAISEVGAATVPPGQ